MPNPNTYDNRDFRQGTTEEKTPNTSNSNSNPSSAASNSTPPDNVRPFRAPQSGANDSPGAPTSGTSDSQRSTDSHSAARGTAAMDEGTRQEVARKGGLAVSRNKQHMSDIGRRGGQSVSRNREHMAEIGRKGGAASRGNRVTKTDSDPSSGGSTPPASGKV